MSIARDIPPCATLPDVRTHSGKRVVATGTYRQIDIRMRRKGSPEYLSFAAIQLQDGIDVLLEPSWSPSARRSEAERRRFDEQQMAVIGTIHLEPPKPPEPVTYTIGPCMSPVEQILPAGEMNT
jgi:hypothetical protein